MVEGEGGGSKIVRYLKSVHREGAKNAKKFKVKRGALTNGFPAETAPQGLRDKRDARTRRNTKDTGTQEWAGGPRPYDDCVTSDECKHSRATHWVAPTMIA